MAGNTFGEIFRITTFGESHGEATGVVIDGCPSGLEIDIDFIKMELLRRAPGQSTITSERKEEENFQILSGLFEGKTLGTPICIVIPNKDQKSSDYDQLKNVYRPSHADYTWEKKYGIRDHRGGGRSSARETVARVVAGAIAKMILGKYSIQIFAFVSSVGTIDLEKNLSEIDENLIESNSVRCPDNITAEKMIKAIEAAKSDGDSLGGKITCVIKNCPSGLGEPVFDKLHADLGKAMLSINAVKGFEYGSGFNGTRMKGSEHNDPFIIENGKTKTESNHSGGIQGGISNGEDIYFNVAFKPTSTIKKEQHTINNIGEEIQFKAEGRHDPCVVPRAVPIVEAMAALTILDHFLKKSFQLPAASY